MLTDERIDTLLRRLDVPATPDRAFESASAAAVLSVVQRARRQDATFLGRMRRDIRGGVSLAAQRTGARRMAMIGITALMLLAAITVLILVAGVSKRPPLGNGPLVVAVGGRLLAIDMADGSIGTVALPGVRPAHVTRSPDGRRVAYWEAGHDDDRLFVAGLDGEAPRRLAASETVSRNGCLDAWSPDSRLLATSVVASGVKRILVVDTDTGEARFVTPAREGAVCTLWSRDGDWIAFDRTPAEGPTVIGKVRPDGTDLQTVGGVPYGHDAEGVNSWSADGVWIYFGGARMVWRTNVDTHVSESLTDPDELSVAPALSPDDKLMSFIVDTPTNWDLYVANADGTHPRLVLKDARNNGWSADGRWILSRWMPADGPGGLVLVAPDGSGHHLVVPEDQACPNRDEGCDMNWGQPKP